MRFLALGVAAGCVFLLPLAGRASDSPPDDLADVVAGDAAVGPRRAGGAAEVDRLQCWRDELTAMAIGSVPGAVAALQSLNLLNGATSLAMTGAGGWWVYRHSIFGFYDDMEQARTVGQREAARLLGVGWCVLIDARPASRDQSLPGEWDVKVEVGGGFATFRARRDWLGRWTVTQTSEVRHGY